MMGNVTHCDPDQVRIDMAVTAHAVVVEEGVAVPFGGRPRTDVLAGEVARGALGRKHRRPTRPGPRPKRRQGPPRPRGRPRSGPVHVRPPERDWVPTPSSTTTAWAVTAMSIRTWSGSQWVTLPIIRGPSSQLDDRHHVGGEPVEGRRQVLAHHREGVHPAAARGRPPLGRGPALGADLAWVELPVVAGRALLVAELRLGRPPPSTRPRGRRGRAPDGRRRPGRPRFP